MLRYKSRWECYIYVIFLLYNGVGMDYIVRNGYPTTIVKPILSLTGGEGTGASKPMVSACFGKWMWAKKSGMDHTGTILPTHGLGGPGGHIKLAPSLLKTTCCLRMIEGQVLISGSAPRELHLMNVESATRLIVV